jgi:hypothetical protein
VIVPLLNGMRHITGVTPGQPIVRSLTTYGHRLVQTSDS